MPRVFRRVLRFTVWLSGVLLATCLAGDSGSGLRTMAAREQQAMLMVRVRVDVHARFDVSCHGSFHVTNPGTLDESHRAHDELTVEYQGFKRFPLRRLVDRVDIDEAEDRLDVKVTSSVSGGGSRYFHSTYTSGSGLGTATRDEATSWQYAAGEGDAPAPTFTYSSDDDNTIEIEPSVAPSVVTVNETAHYAEVAPKRRIVDNDPAGKAMGVATGVMEKAIGLAREDPRFLRQITAKLPTHGPINLSGRAVFTMAETVPASAPRGDTGWNGSAGAGCETPPSGSASYDATVQVDWTLGAGPPAAEVVVTPPPGFGSWRPMAARKGVPGSTLVFAGRVQGVDGEPAESDVPVVVEFELLSSMLPGDSNNHPLQTSMDVDLKVLGNKTSPSLEVISRDAIEEGDYGQRTRLKGTFKVGERFTLAVGSFDYGAFGELRVSGSVPVRVEGQAGTTVMLPKDDNRNHVADSWEVRNIWPGRSTEATADEDDVPDQGYDGDGLSIFEEYRGFYVDGRWLSTKPFERDLFVHSNRRAKTDAGVNQFSASTGIRVHKIQASEMDAEKLVNFNVKFGHGRDQRAVAIELMPTRAAMLAACGSDANSNRSAASIGGCAGDRVVTLWQGLVSVPIVVHELGHLVDVDHHGDGYYDLAPCDAAASDTEVCRKKASTRLKVAAVAASMGLDIDRVVIARQQDETSGVQQCVMRYTWAHFIERSDGSYVPYGKAEPAEVLFCTQRKGTGVNSPEALPWPKTGNATLGICLEQIDVRDKRQ